MRRDLQGSGEGGCEPSFKEALLVGEEGSFLFVNPKLFDSGWGTAGDSGWG